MSAYSEEYLRLSLREMTIRISCKSCVTEKQKRNPQTSGNERI